MKKLSIIAGLLIVLSFSAHATLQITVDTDKDVYQAGENVHVYVTAHNLSTEQVVLHFGISLKASYEMDQIYNWVENKGYYPATSSLRIDAGSSYTWELTHGPTELFEYPLNPGLHSVIGKILASELMGEKSASTQFMVIPEPITITLLCFGAFLIRQQK